MTLDELKSIASSKRALGHNYVQLCVRRSWKAPSNWDKVFVMPGLYGRCVGEVDRAADGKRRFLLDVRLDDVERLMSRFTGAGYDLAAATHSPSPAEEPK